MITKFCAALAAVFVLILVAPAFAAETTIAGELVDQACYLRDKAKNVGAEHRDCAMTCARKGLTVALVTDKGDVYAIRGVLAETGNTALVPHMSHKVELTGEVTENDGKKTITATALKMLKM